MQKIYGFFYRLISSGTTETFHRIELVIDGDILSLSQLEGFELYILTNFHPTATLVQITGSMYLRDSELKLTKKPDVNSTGKKGTQLRKAKP